MPLTSITLPGRQSRARELYDALREAILTGTLGAGERLVEESIASLASVSRTPVREAIRRLEADGLVEDSGSGPVAVSVRSDVLAEMCVVREALEGLAARLAAVGRTELDLLTLQDLAERWRVALENGGEEEEFVRLNHAFHETFWQATGNRYLLEQLRVLRGRIEVSGRTTLGSPTRAAEAMREHDAIIEATVDRDPDRAEEVARAHFRRAMAIRLANLRSTPTGLA